MTRTPRPVLMITSFGIALAVAAIRGLQQIIEDLRTLQR